jgi:hypothetical protein
VSDYIPTTEEMREYVNAGWKFKGEFDRWLKQNNAEVIKATEQRIIKLLEAAKSEELTPEEAWLKGWRFDEPTGRWWLLQEALIALIKGEDNA